MIAHVGAVLLEEALLPLLTGGGAGVLLHFLKPASVRRIAGVGRGRRGTIRRHDSAPVRTTEQPD